MNINVYAHLGLHTHNNKLYKQQQVPCMWMFLPLNSDSPTPLTGRVFWGVHTCKAKKKNIPTFSTYFGDFFKF